jgi:hypothetical protein
MDDPDIRQLSVGLIKAGTTKPSLRTKIMPIAPFVNLFQSWPSNEQLDEKRLRLKAIVLMAITTMTRPSDLAPHGVHLDPETMCVERLSFMTDQIVFNDDHSMTVVFFGIKNDSQRKGFEVRIPAASQPAVDPVSALRQYISCTANKRSELPSPVFLSLKAPYHAIKSNSIAHILEESIALAGLQGQGFTARSFRPTGASQAVSHACSPETAMQIGRWNTKEVFFNRYVYPTAPQDYTDNMFPTDL